MSEEFPSNSKAAPVEPDRVIKPEIRKVVTGEVIQRKQPVGKKFKNIFVNGDAKSALGYVAMDVLIPAAKDAISDAFAQGIDRLLFGDTSRSRSSRGARPGGFVNYSRMGSGRQVRDEPRQMSRKALATHNFDEIILDTKAEADDVITLMFEIISKYEVVTVADLYDIVGITSSFTDNKWGWTDLRGLGSTRTRAGYLLDLQSPEPLK